MSLFPVSHLSSQQRDHKFLIYSISYKWCTAGHLQSTSIFPHHRKQQSVWQTQSTLQMARKKIYTFRCSVEMIQDAWVRRGWKRPHHVTGRTESCHLPSFPLPAHRTKGLTIHWAHCLSLGQLAWERACLSLASYWKVEGSQPRARAGVRCP